jgi:hypothetical protein
MIEMACPSCGRAGQVPKEKLYTRLVCRKCHVVFHVDSTGRPVLGEPVSAAAKEKSKKEGESKSLIPSFKLPTLDDFTGAKDNLQDYTFPVKPVAGVLGGLVFLWLVWGYLAGPGESVADVSRTVAALLDRGELDRLKSYATSDTKDDVVRFYDAAHPKLEKKKEGWPSKESTIQVITVEEDVSKGKGETEVFFMPPAAAVTAAPPPPPPPIPTPGKGKVDLKMPAAPPVPTGPQPASFHLYWVKNGSHWLLDARQSHAMASRTVD